MDLDWESGRSIGGWCRCLNIPTAEAEVGLFLIADEVVERPWPLPRAWGALQGQLHGLGARA